MEFKKQNPIYLQIADLLCDRIMHGECTADGRMPSVRDVAMELGVNPNTVMRTFEYLQNNDIIYNRRGVGYFVSPQAVKTMRDVQRKQFLKEEWPQVLQRLQSLGLMLHELPGLDSLSQPGGVRYGPDD